MKARYLLLTPLLLLALGGVAYTLLDHGVHEFGEEQCAECHADKPVKGRRETLRMTAPVQQLCDRCHRSHLENALSHPVEMAPRNVVLPADFPLSWNGKVTCSTCHDIHAAAANNGAIPRKFLRRSIIGPDFCSICHTRDATTGARHRVGVVHMKFTADQQGGPLDKISRMCLSCHDGSVGALGDVEVRSGSWKHGVALSRYDPQGSHPIGVKYQRAFARRGGFRPPGSLDPAIKLVDGKVSCRSCHDLYSKEQALLVVSNAGSRLCLGCHDK